ncbi:MAG: hypothetical protein PUG18_06245 [Lachnospiraceae bacterium]|nr:hypothetical protein [Lachnospiraceae bacterium]
MQNAKFNISIYGSWRHLRQVCQILSLQYQPSCVQVHHFSEVTVTMTNDKPDIFASVMLRSGPHKLVCYHHAEDRITLVNVEDDPLEEVNLIDSLPALRDFFLQYIRENIDFEAMERTYRKNCRAASLFRSYENATVINDAERWKEN